MIRFPRPSITARQPLVVSVCVRTWQPPAPVTSERGTRFGIETTFTRCWRLGLVREALTRNYLLEAIFVGTADPALNFSRVRERPRAGSGYLVPAATVRRRWLTVQNYLVSLAPAFSTIRIVESTLDPAVLSAVVDRVVLSVYVPAPAPWILALLAALRGRRQSVSL